MPARKYKTDPVQLLAEGQQIVHTTSDAKYRHKVEMVNLVLDEFVENYKEMPISFFAEIKNDVDKRGIIEVFFNKSICDLSAARRQKKKPSCSR